VQQALQNKTKKMNDQQPSLHNGTHLASVIAASST
jgi:hypothetical protein